MTQRFVPKEVLARTQKLLDPPCFPSPSRIPLCSLTTSLLPPSQSIAYLAAEVFSKIPFGFIVLGSREAKEGEETLGAWIAHFMRATARDTITQRHGLEGEPRQPPMPASYSAGARTQPLKSGFGAANSDEAAHTADMLAANPQLLSMLQQVALASSRRPSAV